MCLLLLTREDQIEVLWTIFIISLEKEKTIAIFLASKSQESTDWPGRAKGSTSMG
jgi:hypothetical protein